MSSETRNFNELHHSLNKLHPRNEKARVFSGKKFPHDPVNKILKNSPPLISGCKEVSSCLVTYQELKREEIWNDSSRKPVLRSQVCDYMSKGRWPSIETKNNFIGANLLLGYEDYVPLPVEALNSVESLLKGFERYNNGLPLKKTTFISLRHHIIDIIMCPFNDEPLSLLMTLLPDGNILVTVDKSHYKANGIHQIKNTHLRKICYTGFSLETLLTKGTKDSADSLFYSMVHGSLNETIDLFLQAEMDSYNSATEKYTEIKSSVNFNLNSVYHRRKLLRMWIQTNLLPSSDLLIGFRNSYSNELERLQPYTVNDIYKKFNNQSIFSKKSKFYNFNGKVAKDWCDYIFPTLKDAVKSYGTSKDSKVFRLQISRELIVKVIPLHNTLPIDVELNEK